MATLAERVLALTDQGYNFPTIAAILNLTPQQVEEVWEDASVELPEAEGGGGGSMVIGPYSAPVILWEVATADEQMVRWQPDADHPTVVQLTFQYQTPGGLLDFLVLVGPEKAEKSVNYWSEPDVKEGIHQRTATVLVGAGEWIQVIGTNGGGGEGASFEASAITAVIGTS